MWTDGSLATGYKFLREMEHLRQVVLGVAFPQAAVEGRALVIAFRNQEEVNAFVPAQFVAQAHSSRGGIWQPMIVINLNTDDDGLETATHELSHVISFGAIADQPSWFAEGLASYFETVNLDADRATVDVGDVDPRRSRAYTIKHEGFLPTAQLFACNRIACEDHRFYATTWALYSYLINVHPAELQHYQALLAALPAAQQGHAWQEAFPNLPPGKLDHELAEWFFHGRHTTWHYTVALREPHITTRPLRDADVNAARGMLRAYAAPDKAPEPPEIAAALAADPTNLLANLVRGSLAEKVDAEAARDVTAAHPDDWRSWYLLLRADLTANEARAARAQLCALAPNPTLLPPDWCASQ